MKISILYHSITGNTKKIADLIAEGAQEVANIEAKCMSIDDIDDEYLNESNAVIFGCPTYYADFSWQIKKWFDEAKKYNLSGKIGASFATANFYGGGAEIALLSMTGYMLSKGMLVYSGGCALGQPYTHVGTVAIKDGTEQEKNRAKVFGNRIALKTREIFSE